MSGNYPPGMTSRDFVRAGIDAPDPPECPECGHLIAEPEDHADDCPEATMDALDLQEAERERHTRDWDDVKEDPTPAEAERYDLERGPSDE